MSDDHYTSGRGHFGDQSGDVSQQKQFVSPGSRLHEKMDLIQKEFWDRGIMIEVRAYDENCIRGTREIFIVGGANYIDAARRHLPSAAATYRPCLSQNGYDAKRLTRREAV